jgi:hypothetical protein
MEWKASRPLVSKDLFTQMSSSVMSLFCAVEKKKLKTNSRMTKRISSFFQISSPSLRKIYEFAHQIGENLLAETGNAPRICLNFIT